MFYSPEMLSLKNKTSLALLFYISTTSNKSKKVNKKEIESVDITNALVTLKHPPQPFALRLYSILIKGLVKIYSMKIKYCESEINLFYKAMMVHKKKTSTKKPKIINLKFKDLFQANNFMVDLEDVKVYNLFDNETEPKSIETMVIQDQTSNNFEPVDFFSDIEINRFDTEQTTKKRIIDQRTEFTDKLTDNEQLLCTKNMKIAKNSNPIQSIYVCRELQKILQEQMHNKQQGSNPEILRNQSMISFVPQTTSTSLLNNDYISYDNNIDNETESYDKSINFDEIQNEEYNFTEKVKNYSKKEKALNFMKLLNFCKSQNVTVKQEKPFSDIKIIKKYV